MNEKENQTKNFFRWSTHLTTGYLIFCKKKIWRNLKLWIRFQQQQKKLKSIVSNNYRFFLNDDDGDGRFSWIFFFHLFITNIINQLCSKWYRNQNGEKKLFLEHYLWTSLFSHHHHHVTTADLLSWFFFSSLTKSPIWLI